MIKLIATDLDGTLLGPDGQLHPRTIAAVEAAQDAQIEVVAATGRSYRSALPRLAPARSIVTAVCSNGSVVYDVRAEEVRLHRPIASAVVHAAINLLRDLFPEVGFGFEALPGFHFDEAFLSTGPNGGSPTMDEIHYERTSLSLDELGEITKLFIGIPGLVGADLQHALAAVMPATLTAVTSGAAFVEATAAEVNKASTVAMLAAERGIGPENVLVFGDQLNDVAMLSWAGHAVAMGNAAPAAIEAAHHQTLTNGEHGVAVVIERLLAGEDLFPTASPT